MLGNDAGRAGEGLGIGLRALPCELCASERRVLAYLVWGLSNVGIAEAAGLRVGTVKSYLGSIYAKLGVGSRAAAIHAAAYRFPELFESAPGGLPGGEGG